MAHVVEPIQLQEHPEISNAFEHLLSCLPQPLSEEDRQNIHRAFEVAMDAHSLQVRSSGEPYILHPIEVARICVEEIELGPTAVVAALLHDVVEDTSTTLEDINSIFGSKIGKIVDGLTKLDTNSQSKTENLDRRSPQAANFRKVLSTLVDDVRIVLIKMADRLHNMRTLGAMPRHKQLKIADETTYIYAPLAHQLGLNAIKTEFNDLALEIVEPEIYEEIKNQLEQTEEERNEYIQRFIAPLHDVLKNLPYSYRIFGRPKSIASIWNKIKTKGVELESMYDIFAIRVVIENGTKKQDKDRCWEVYSGITDIYDPLPERLKDWVSYPQPNGYRSLHTTVLGPDGRFVEVQIRTEQMEDIAERGFAAHWKYKQNLNASENVYEKWLKSVREVLEDDHADSLEFVLDFKLSSLFDDVVHVYTPKGDSIVLPKGATALDFAFSIHSDVGYHCVALHVNGRVVPMGHILKNGDQINVITNKNQKPSEDWLKLVITSKAKNKIRSVVREERRKRGELPREQMERKLEHLKIPFETGMEVILAQYPNYKSKIDFFFAIATDSLPSVSDMMRSFKVADGKLNFIEPLKAEPQPVESASENAAPAHVYKGGTPKLKINGEPADVYEYSLATCCNPVQGDTIFAYVTASSGMKIHRANCPNAVHLLSHYGHRVMKAEWDYTNDLTYVAELKITGIDDGVGVIEKIAHNISSNLNLNIRSFSISGEQGYFECRIKIVVQSTTQVNHTIQELKKLSNVKSVQRV